MIDNQIDNQINLPINKKNNNNRYNYQKLMMLAIRIIKMQQT